MQKIGKICSPEIRHFSPPPGILAGVIKMKYEDPNMEAYWNTLSPQVQARIDDAGIELCSLGMLMKLGDYYQNSQEEPKSEGDFHA